MNVLNSVATTVLASLALFATPVLAQGAPDIEGSIIQQGQITDLLRDEDRVGQAMIGNDGEIEGEAGVYVLQLNEIFFIGGTAGMGYSENPQRTSLNTSDSFFSTAGFTAGVQTRLGGKVDFGVRANLSGIEYFDESAPSSRSVVGNMTAGVPIGDTPLYASVSAFAGYNFDDEFNNSTSFYGASASLGAGIVLGPQTLLRPGVGVTRQWSAISENNSTSASASVTLLHQPAPRVTLAAELQVSRAWFDNFYEDVTFVERNDWSYSGGVSASWSPVEWFSVSASAGYEKRDSAFFISEYEGFDAAVSMTFRRRF